MTLVTADEEMTRARSELLAGGPTDYVILRVSESASGNENRAHSLRRLIAEQHFVARHPTTGEYQALEEGSKRLLPDQ